MSIYDVTISVLVSILILISIIGISIIKKNNQTMKEELKPVIIKDLLNLLAEHGGEIVSSNELSPEMIDEARLTNRLFVDENSMGYVWQPKFKNDFPCTPEEVDLFEKFYPLKVSVPKNLSFENLLQKMERKEGREEQLKQAIEELHDKVKDFPKYKFDDFILGAESVLQDPSTLRHADPEIMDKAGWESSAWISCKKETPLAYESGHWDGQRSDLVLVGDIEGKVKIGRVYKGILDGNEFCNWYDEDDNDLMITPYKWKKIF